MRFNRIEAGDLVKLKSGGPSMTVEFINNDPVPIAICVWFDTAFHRQSFRVSSLERDDELT